MRYYSCPSPPPTLPPYPTSCHVAIKLHRISRISPRRIIENSSLVYGETIITRASPYSTLLKLTLRKMVVALKYRANGIKEGNGIIPRLDQHMLLTKSEGDTVPSKIKINKASHRPWEVASSRHPTLFAQILPFSLITSKPNFLNPSVPYPRTIKRRLISTRLSLSWRRGEREIFRFKIRVLEAGCLLFTCGWKYPNQP